MKAKFGKNAKIANNEKKTKNSKNAKMSNKTRKRHSESADPAKALVYHCQ